MNKKANQELLYRKIFPTMKFFLGFGRKLYNLTIRLKTGFRQRTGSSSVIPDTYTVCNTQTKDSKMKLHCLDGSFPNDLDGSLFICQCLGSPSAFMVGDTNIVRLDFKKDGVELTNRQMWTPAAIARIKLAETRHRFEFLGLMYLSPGLGLYSYTEGMYLLPDGRIAVTSDVDRPWVIERDSLRAVTPLGRREEWLPMMEDTRGEIMGNLFAGYNNSHVIYNDTETGEVFFANFQYRKQAGQHPVKLMRWNGDKNFDSWHVLDNKGEQIEIKQSIHELVFTKDFILLTDTAFVAGTEMFTPWINSPLPDDKTIIYIIDRRKLNPKEMNITANKVVVDEACIHILAEYDNPEGIITAYMLHTPATNTAELLRAGDRTLDGDLFPEHTIGYGTLPVLDLSSIGKHVIDAGGAKVIKSDYIAQMPYTWGPYLYAYIGRQTKPYNGQDLFIMFKGFSRDMLPERIYKAYKDVENRRVPIDDMVGGSGMQHNNSICRISTGEFSISDSYIFPDKVLLYTIACLDSSINSQPGYIIAGVATDDFKKGSSGHEYWLFKADDLAAGPVSRMGHESLNNSTLFHTVYIPSSFEKEQFTDAPTYNVSLRDDYPAKELKKWDPEVTQTFKDLIWPYFDKTDLEVQATAIDAVADLASDRINEHAGREEVIAEEPVADATEFAKRMKDEALRIWSSTGWKIERSDKGVRVESKPVSGDFADSGIMIMRSRGLIEADAAEVFTLLTSPEGFAILDPVSSPEDHHNPPLEIYPWKEGSRLEAALAKVNIPIMPKAEFVVLNAIDHERMLFVSKSIIHPGHSGSSIYYKGTEEDALNQSKKTTVTRALNTMGILVKPVSIGKAELFVLNYVDMAMKKGQGAGLYNMINRKFFHPLYKRTIKHLNKKNK